MTAHSGVGWTLAESLIELENEANAFALHRSKDGDGTIGDRSHASRKSDHNPDANGYVCALDLTHDPAGGFDSYAIADKIAAEIVAGRETRVAGIGSWNVNTKSERWFGIHNGKWSWRDTNLAGGSHQFHLHVSVNHNQDAYHNMRSWNLAVTQPPVILPKPKPTNSLWEFLGQVTLAKKKTLRAGDTGVAVKALQIALTAAGYFCLTVKRGKKAYPDGVFGPQTAAAVRRFQQDHRITVDGIVGPQTWSRLG